MTTGRINQVATRIAIVAVRDDSGDCPTDVLSPFRSSHESFTVSTASPGDRRSSRMDRSVRPTGKFTVRLPSSRSEVGIRKTVKVQVPKHYQPDISFETAVARKRHHRSALSDIANR